MKSKDKSLFQTGEVVKVLGITRRILMNYENLGLVTPAIRNEGHGIRYYTVDNIVHIKIIRTLQKLGLSLAEIHSYFDNTVRLNEQIDRLVLLRNELDQYIAQLRLRRPTSGDMEIHRVTLPAITGYCHDFQTTDIAQKTNEIRQAFVEATRNHKIDTENKLCMQVSVNNADDGEYIVPVAPGTTGKNIKVFPQVQAICIYFRGPYENFSEIREKLLEYAKENNMTPTGYFRSIFMEGPPTHGANKNAYITQIALPIKFITIEERD